MSTHPETPPHLPPYYTLLSCPRTSALSALLYTLNLHWSSILHIVLKNEKKLTKTQNIGGRGSSVSQTTKG